MCHVIKCQNLLLLTDHESGEIELVLLSRRNPFFYCLAETAEIAEIFLATAFARPFPHCEALSAISAISARLKLLNHDLELRSSSLTLDKA